MDPLTLALIMGGGNVVKDLLSQDRINKANIAQAEQTRMSPWTHFGQGHMTYQDPVGDAISGAGSGALMGMMNGGGNQAGKALAANNAVDSSMAAAPSANDFAMPTSASPTALNYRNQSPWALMVPQAK